MKLDSLILTKNEDTEKLNKVLIPALDNPPDFKLLFRGTRDNFDFNTMQNNSSDKGPLIIVLRTQQFGVIVAFVSDKEGLKDGG